MRKKIFSPIPGVLVLAMLYAGYNIAANRYCPYRNIQNVLEPRFEEPVLAIYKPTPEDKLPKPREIAHFALKLRAATDWDLKLDLLENLDPETPVLLTIELWEKNVLQKMTDGEYDQKTKDLLSSIAAAHSNIFLRWNPEMEVPYSDYPWGNFGSLYAAAFEQFQQLAKQQFPEAKIVWGPSGYSGLMETFPLNANPDVATITLNSNTEVNLDSYQEESTQEEIKRKLHRLRFVDLPVLILGSKNTELQKINRQLIEKISEEIEQEKEMINFRNIFEKGEENRFMKKHQKPLIGVFDPNQNLVQEEAISVEHIFISFTDIRDGSYLEDLEEIFSRDHDAILTVEPFLYNNEADDDRLILKKILEGEYDEIFRQFYQSIEEKDHTIYLRFAHEMEIPITRYPWQSQDPIEYIKAYRHFMQFPEEDLPNVLKVWGPAGDRGLLEWWPGEDVVDIISIAIYGLPDKNITDPEKQESFKKVYKRKNNRIRLLDKPLFITEFGVKGDEEFQTRWLIQAAEAIRSEPNIIGVNYFNREDVPEAWGEIRPPEWSISRETFFRFVEALKTEVSTIKKL